MELTTVQTSFPGSQGPVPELFGPTEGGTGSSAAARSLSLSLSLHDLVLFVDVVVHSSFKDNTANCMAEHGGFDVLFFELREGPQDKFNDVVHPGNT